MLWLAPCSTVIVFLGLALKTKLVPLDCLPRIPLPLKSPGISLKTKPQSYRKKEESNIGVIQFKVLWDDKCVEGGWEEEHKASWQAGPLSLL